jgi:hypothetical protein
MKVLLYALIWQISYEALLKIEWKKMKNRLLRENKGLIAQRIPLQLYA